MKITSKSLIVIGDIDCSINLSNKKKRNNNGTPWEEVIMTQKSDLGLVAAAVAAVKKVETQLLYLDY